MKSLVSPLLLIFLLLAVALVAWAIFRRRETVGSWRSWLVFWAVFFISVMLYLPATWFGSEWLRGSLVPKPQERLSERYSDWEPDWIVVLAGGIARGAEPEENVLSAESALRVARAVTLARLYPEAGFIFSGGRGQEAGDRMQEQEAGTLLSVAESSEVATGFLTAEALAKVVMPGSSRTAEEPPSNRGINPLATKQETGDRGREMGDGSWEMGGSVVQLMQELALARGIEPERCRLEMASTNTMEHPKGILGLEGVEVTDRILVVSSDWHLPRARMVFDPVFDAVRYEGSSMRLRTGPLWKRLIPNEEALAASALYLREWVGRGWYFLKR